MDKEAIDLAAALAGAVNHELQEVPNRKPINPTEFLINAGVPMNRPQQQIRSMNFPGTIEAPKSTPMGSEVLTTTADMPNLIPIPADLQKFVDGDPQLDPNVVIPTVTAPPVQQAVKASPNDIKDPVMVLNHINDQLAFVIEELHRLSEFVIKRDKYWSKKSNKSKKKPKVINETISTPIAGSGQAYPTTPGSTNQTT